MNAIHQNCIVAISTAPGMGALAVIRLSGEGVFDIVSKVFTKNLAEVPSHTIHYGHIKDDKKIVDEVMIAVFKAPKSFTTEDSVEISCHGSTFIQKEIVDLLIKHGATLAKPGEFTMRAFLNGRIDLSQAEAVADLIASENAAHHKMAIQQMRGGFSKKLNELRGKLIHFASLIELENDFSEEDVEFADRTELINLIKDVLAYISMLIASFKQGNAIKKGIPVVIAGAPNVGKSTLLNALLEEDKAIISDIAGTTRDFIEDSINVDGIQFRFIDTAGLRETEDTIEALGIERSKEQMEKAAIILYMVELDADYKKLVAAIQAEDLPQDAYKIILINKADKESSCSIYDIEEAVSTELGRVPTLAISAASGQNIEKLKAALVNYVNDGVQQFDFLVHNNRHVQALSNVENALTNAMHGLESNVSSDFVAIDIRHAIHHIAEITGEISTDDLLDRIFRDFCIGK